MILTSVQVESCAEVNSFVTKAQLRILKGLPAESIHFGVNIKSFKNIKEKKTSIIYGYTLPAQKIIQALVFMLAAVIFVFKGFSWLLIIPIILFFIPAIVRFLGFFLLGKGLRKAGYTGKIKLLFNNDALAEVVFNVTR